MTQGNHREYAYGAEKLRRFQEGLCVLNALKNQELMCERKENLYETWEFVPDAVRISCLGAKRNAPNAPL